MVPFYKNLQRKRPLYAICKLNSIKSKYFTSQDLQNLQVPIDLDEWRTNVVNIEWNESNTLCKNIRNYHEIFLKVYPMKRNEKFVQSLTFFQMIHAFSIFTKYIYQEFNGSKIAKKVSSFQTLCLMIFNVICYGVNREVWQQLTSSAIL